MSQRSGNLRMAIALGALAISVYLLYLLLRVLERGA